MKLLPKITQLGVEQEIWTRFISFQSPLSFTPQCWTNSDHSILVWLFKQAYRVLGEPGGNAVVAQSSVGSYSVWPHRLQHARLPCPSLSPGVCSNSCPLSQWCYLCSSLSPLSPLALNLSQHHVLFWWVSSSHQVAKVLELQLQYQSFQWIFWIGLGLGKIDWFDLLAVPGALRVFFSTTVPKYQFFGAQPSLWPNSHIWTWLLEKP